MNLPQQVADHFRGVYSGGNWTVSNLKDNLADVTWQQATTQVYSLNTIAALVYHIHYYVHAAVNVLQGSSLEAHDQFSFEHPPINSQEDWENFLAVVWNDAERFAKLVAQLPADQFGEDFADQKYGTYYRNIHGIIEHTHYHLGQIAIIKKIVRQQ